MELSWPALAAGTPSSSPFLLVASPYSERVTIIFPHLYLQQNIGLPAGHLPSLPRIEAWEYTAGALYIFAQGIASKCYLLSPQLCLPALPMWRTEGSMGLMLFLVLCMFLHLYPPPPISFMACSTPLENLSEVNQGTHTQIVFFFFSPEIDLKPPEK